MKRYRNDAGSPTRIDYGIGLSAGLRAFTETQPLAQPFEQTNDELESAYLNRQARRKPMVVARSKVRFGNYHVDQGIRMLDGAARIADGGRRGPVTTALFPEGLTAVVKPKGAAQIQPTKDLLDRFSKCKLPRAIALHAEWAPRITALLEALKLASEGYDVAKQAYVDAFAEEIAMRAEHARQVDRLMGLVRAEFPRDTARQDVIFPEPARESGLPEEDEVEDEVEDEEVAATAKTAASPA